MNVADFGALLSSRWTYDRFAQLRIGICIHCGKMKFELSYLFTGEHYRTGICSVQIDEDEDIFET